MKNFKYFLLAIFVGSTAIYGCDKNKKLNVFSIQDDKNLGKQLRDQILSNPQEYPVLNPATHVQAYAYMNNMVQKILNSGNITHRNEFDWEVYIIDQDVLNAFVAPGGYMFFYTGLIKYLESEDQLAGVMGHEIAHADRRHSTNRLTKAYGLDVLFGIILGNESLIKDVAASLIFLSYSRSDEREADDFGVKYLCPTDYKADGSARFFEKILEDFGSSGPQFLSTHPNPENRVNNIRQRAQNLGCQGTSTFDAEYAAFKSLLP